MNQCNIYFPCTIIILIVCFCNYIFQFVLNTMGGIISWAIIFVAAFIVLFSRNKTSYRYASYFGVNRILFYILYFVVFSMGATSLPTVLFLGISVPKQIYGLIFFIIMVECIMRIVSNTTEKEKDNCKKLLLFIFITVALGNIVVVLLNPSLAKAEAAEGGIFVLGYGMSYTLALLMPTCIYKIEEHNNQSKIYMILMVLCILSVFLASYFIAITAILFSILTYIVVKKKNILFTLLLSVLAIALIVTISSGQITSILYNLAGHVSNYQLQERLLQIARFNETGLGHVTNADTTYRFVLYSNTWNNFFKHPLLGNFVFGNFDCFYDHATFLDMLSTGGILLGGLYMLFLRNNFRLSATHLNDTKAKSALLATYLTYFYLAVFNSVFSYSLIGLLTVLPVLLRKGPGYEDFDNASL